MCQWCAFIKNSPRLVPSASTMPVVESLAQQCYTYIMMHLEEFLVRGHLSLLPLSTRKELLYHLPIADVCLRLENTEFTEGIDMAAFWNSVWDHDTVGIAESVHDKEDIKHYVQDKWDDLEYAREAVYGTVASCAMGHVTDIELRAFFPAVHPNCEEHKDLSWGMPVVMFLYTLRTSCVHDPCQPPFPPRYKHKTNKSEEDLTMYEVVNCFSHSKGEFPRLFPELELLHINLDNVYFLRNAVYLGLTGFVFDKQGFEFLKAVLQVATNLEVLLLGHWGDEDEWEVEFFDKFCASLSTSQAFLSNFRWVKIFCYMDLGGKGLVVSRKNFNQLITAYFAAPTDHVQKLHIARTKIKCSDVSFERSPMIEQRYRSFKTSDCQFVSKYKATPKALSHWLGESISELPQSDPEPDICFFKVGGKSEAGLSRKRKHSELELDDHDQAER